MYSSPVLIVSLIAFWICFLIRAVASGRRVLYKKSCFESRMANLRVPILTLTSWRRKTDSSVYSMRGIGMYPTSSMSVGTMTLRMSFHRSALNFAIKEQIPGQASPVLAELLIKLIRDVRNFTPSNNVQGRHRKP